NSLSLFLSMSPSSLLMIFFPSIFFFNDPPPPEIYTLSLHDALPIFHGRDRARAGTGFQWRDAFGRNADQRSERHRDVPEPERRRSEEHTSELQSRGHLVCRLLLEKKKKKKTK